MKIPMPGNEEKELTIQNIVAAGMPEQQGIWHNSAKLIRQVGLRHIVFGIWDCIFLATVITVTVVGMLFLSQNLMVTAGATVLFAISPLFYGLMYNISAWKEIQSGTAELLKTCRFSLRQLTVVRMLCFGGAGCLFNIVPITLIWNVGDGVYLFTQLLGLSLCSLFLYAVLTMATMMNRKTIRYPFIAPTLWGITILLLACFAEGANAILFSLPQIAVWVILAALIAVFIWELRSYLYAAKKGVHLYA